MCRHISSLNRSSSAARMCLADAANAKVQKAWADGKLPDNVSDNLKMKSIIHMRCLKGVGQTPHSSAGNIHRQLCAM